MNWLELYQHLGQALPEMWLKFNEERVRKVPPGYIDFIIPACYLLGTVLTTDPERTDKDYVPTMGELTGAGITAKLMDSGLRVNYITETEFINAEEVPTNITCSQLNLTREAGIIMFPDDMVNHPIEGPVGYLAYARIRKGEPLLIVYNTGEVRSLLAPARNDVLFFFFSTHTYLPSRPSYHYHVPVTMAMDLSTCIANREISNYNKGTYYFGKIEPDMTFNAYLTNMGCRILYQEHKLNETRNTILKV